MKRILLPVVILLICFSANAQTIKERQQNSNHIRVYYDPNSTTQPFRIIKVIKRTSGRPDSLKQVQKIWYGRYVDFYLTLNPFLYDITLNSRQISEERPDDAAALTKFNNVISKFETAKSSTEGTKEEKENTLAPQELTQKSTGVTEVFENMSPRKSAEIQTILFDKGLDPENTFVSKARTVIKNRLLRDTLVKAYDEYKRDYNETINHYKKRHGDFISTLYHFDSALANAKQVLSPCEQVMVFILTDKIDSATRLRLTDSILSRNNLGTTDEFIIKAPHSLEVFMDSLTRSSNRIQNAFALLKDMRDSIPDYKNAFAIDSSLFAVYQKAYSKLIASNPEVVPTSLASLLLSLRSPNIFIHHCATVQANCDTLKFLLQTKSSARYDSIIRRYGIQTSPDSVILPVAVKGNFKLNLSVGASFQYGKLRPTSYYFDSAFNAAGDMMHDSLTIREANRTNRFKPLLAAYMHAYINLRLLNYFTPSFTIGLSTNPTDLSDASFMIGASMIFGTQNRFIATVGLAGTGVDYLKGKYKTNTPYANSRFTNVTETDLAEKTFKAGVFFGFSYNISNSR